MPTSWPAAEACQAVFASVQAVPAVQVIQVVSVVVAYQVVAVDPCSSEEAFLGDLTAYRPFEAVQAFPV